MGSEAENRVSSVWHPSLPFRSPPCLQRLRLSHYALYSIPQLLSASFHELTLDIWIWSVHRMFVYIPHLLFLHVCPFTSSTKLFFQGYSAVGNNQIPAVRSSVYCLCSRFAIGWLISGLAHRLLKEGRYLWIKGNFLINFLTSFLHIYRFIPDLAKTR